MRNAEPRGENPWVALKEIVYADEKELSELLADQSRERCAALISLSYDVYASDYSSFSLRSQYRIICFPAGTRSLTQEIVLKRPKMTPLRCPSSFIQF